MVAPRSACAVSCRIGRAEDRDYITGLAARTFVDFGDYRAIIDQWLDAPRVSSLLLEESDERRGFALVAEHRALGFWRSPSAELVAIALEPDARGRGLGSLLLQAAEAAACGFGAREMRLHTADQNHVARVFFAAAGYREREGRTTYYPNGQPAIELRRSLS